MTDNAYLKNEYHFAFLDSGTGGLPYMLYLREERPDIHCVYIADTRNFPYGEKNSEEIIFCASETTREIIEKCNPRAIILACNTISVYALEALRVRFTDTHFVGTVPAIKLASSLSKKRRIGLLATKATVNAPYTQKLIDSFASDCTIVKRADNELIRFIEKDLPNATEGQKKDAIMGAMSEFIHADIDVLVLACTHFIHLVKEMQEVMEESHMPFQIIDSREGVVKQALTLLTAQGAQTISIKKTNYPPSLYTTSITQNNCEYRTIAETLHMTWKGQL